MTQEFGDTGDIFKWSLFLVFSNRVLTLVVGFIFLWVYLGGSCGCRAEQGLRSHATFRFRRTTLTLHPGRRLAAMAQCQCPTWSRPQCNMSRLNMYPSPSRLLPRAAR